MNILTLISRDLQKASTHFRVVQYLDFFKSNGIKLEFVNRKTLSRSILPQVRSSDLLLNQKCLFNYSLAKRMIKESRRAIFDFDDAIFTRPGRPDSFITRIRVKRRLKLWLSRSHAVTTPNEFLADYARRYSGSVRVVPMALDLDIWRPRKKRSEKPGPVIGWAGSPVNVPLIEKLEPVLSRLKEKYPRITIAVFSGKKPRFGFPFKYFPFLPGKEPEFIQKLDIGLLPLQNDEFSKGKSPIKAIQYLACGVPVVGNVFGASKEILNEANSIAVITPEDWVSGIERLVASPELAKSMGESGREHIEENNDIAKVREKFLKVIRED